MSQPRSPAEIERQEREMAAMKEAAAKFLARGGEIKTTNDCKPTLKNGKPLPAPRKRKPSTLISRAPDGIELAEHKFDSAGTSHTAIARTHW
jgi:hypothetical protein